MTRSINAGMNTELADYYVWEAFDRPITICLEPQAAERLQVAVLTTRSSGRELPEVGGVLWGSTKRDGDRLITFIQDFRVVGRRNGHDPLYELSKEDVLELEAVIASSQSEHGRPLSPVGYYRSHNRDGLYLSVSDLAIIHTYFPQSEAVFMLIKTLRSGACTAGFFLWDNGRIQTEFPCIEVPLAPVDSAPPIRFDLHSAVSAPPPAAPPSPPARASDFDVCLQPSADARAFEVCLFQTPSPPAAKRFLRIIAAFGLLIGVGVAGIAVAPHVWPELRYAVPQLHSGILLNAYYTADRLMITWDRSAPEILTAEHAILRIWDGPNENTIMLNADQLRTGRTTYAASGDTVGFRLELYRRERLVSAASIRVAVMNQANPSKGRLSR